MTDYRTMAENLLIYCRCHGWPDKETRKRLRKELDPKRVSEVTAIFAEHHPKIKERRL